jgi:hypothetical protein
MIFFGSPHLLRISMFSLVNLNLYILYLYTAALKHSLHKIVFNPLPFKFQVSNDPYHNILPISSRIFNKKFA